ncbi:hypothetical protein [Maritimibacter sp. DP1N21-5]|uniref:hypothetical protein n=1 Tax=Maritimibacter sp. DP1N21-5 TaxID=2836867 RepID=UPI001C440684|nr:hypothetical protein [Maritimibacter sp. DP1N21-5]MBV7408778.1 hypothetical protein [Maritimibacter sp. DP1N21-5]
MSKARQNADGIEYGSNANGSYTKFPDGTLICWMDHSFGPPSGWSGTAGNKLENYTWTYPHAFLETPRVFASGDQEQAAANTTGEVIISPRRQFSNSATAAKISAKEIGGTNDGNSAAGSFLAIGRWK